ncbi:ferritin-like domain-containing protein [Podospora aff. communis PSN243]|uniref:Ferritin-like domain-containing protein n=1 Tax=Podospora aff. communis PSN243 TaxID=3040156 RepID=A0AAV9GEH5_9PEZI|nr:ferritin-like domain-containing protein [Podospora aff. communis PSN243]
MFILLPLLPLLRTVSAAPVAAPDELEANYHGYPRESQYLADPTYGPIPGESDIYNYYWGTDRPFPGNITAPIFPTARGPPGVDDWTWQNLLSAEWIIFEFYQRAVELFTQDSFTAAGLPPTTYRRILEIRNNEAGHLRIFQNQISPTSIKPGACRYTFPFADPISFLALMTVLEISSMAFLTGLVQQPRLPAGRSAMIAIAEVETRHETWALIDIWKADPFGGPSDTVFPYANEILDTTNAFIVPGSCPPENPEFPHPRQKLPALSAGKNTPSLTPGSRISLDFTDPTNQPRFKPGRQYYAVFFHGVGNVSVPIDTAGWPGAARREIWVTIPERFETKGVVVAVVADRVGAPTKESIVAGPGVILEQPAVLATALLKGGKAEGV